MKKVIYPTTKAFRTTDELDQELESLAQKSNRNASDIIREAVWSYVSHYKARPNEIRRVA